MSPFSKRLVGVVVGVVAVGGAFIAGTFYGTKQSLALVDSTASILNKDSVKSQTVDFAPFWKAWNILNERFVPTKNHATTTDQDRVWGAIQGLASSYGDPY